MRCKFDGCLRDSRSSGYCGGHYQQLKARGDEALLTPLRERLKIDKTAKCCIEGCENLVEKKHMCGMHYQRKKKTGDPLTVRTPPSRLQPTMDKLMRRLEVGDENECWEWQGSRNSKGYGKITADEIGEQIAHRVAYRLFVGEIPDNLFVCHHCDNPPCCNPKHLFLGTVQDNTQDMVEKRRQRRKLTDDDIKIIRDKNYSLKELQDRFQISASMIGLIRRKQSYRYIN